jgi:hypothetical protein
VQALGAVDAGELADVDRRAYADAQLRVAAVRVALTKKLERKGIDIVARASDGKTCVALRDAKGAEQGKRCTYGLVWTASAVANRDGTALALAVQPAEGWRELWLYRKTKAGWRLTIIPPATAPPGVGTAEFAGWAKGKLRIERAALIDGRLRRDVQLVRTARSR